MRGFLLFYGETCSLGGKKVSDFCVVMREDSDQNGKTRPFKDSWFSANDSLLLFCVLPSVVPR